MPIYRKTEGGVFAPVTALNINDSGAFKSVAAAWINDNGTFKKVFPNTPPEPISAADSPLYDIATATSSIVAASGNNTIRSYHVSNSRIPLSGEDTPTITSSRVIFRDTSGNIIQFGTRVSDQATTGLQDEFTDVLTYRTVNSALSVAVTSETNIKPIRYWRELDEGTMIVQEWEWTINNQTYYYTFSATAIEDSYN